ncbi:MAG: glycosyltransferase [Candidatus Solibacter usitatus]|nr:glycosyltransferase [Candidatus Solibacter usitatus]
MSRALFLSPEPPYPLTGGGQLRTAALLEYVARRFDTDLVLFHVDGASDPAEGLPPHLVKEVYKLRLPAHSKRPVARAVRNLGRLARRVPPLLDRFSGKTLPLDRWLQGRTYDLAIIEHFWAAPYADVLRKHASTLVLDLHNIESEWHERFAAHESFPASWVHLEFANLYRAREQQWLPRFDCILTPSQREADRIRTSNAAVHVYPNTIPHAVLPVIEKTQSLVFSGNWEYEPNRRGLRFFLHQVWPAVRAKHPDLRLRCLGKNPHAIAEMVGPDTSIEMTGPVGNAVEELARSTIAVVPLLSGSGTRVKVLEAWAAGLPIVSTRLGVEGLDAIKGTHCHIADSPGEFAFCILHLLNDDALRARLGRAGRVLYEEAYTWEAGWKKLEKIDSLTRAERLY